MANFTVVPTPSAHTSARVRDLCCESSEGGCTAPRCGDRCWSWPGDSFKLALCPFISMSAYRIDFKICLGDIPHFNLVFSLCKHNRHGDYFKLSNLQLSYYNGVGFLRKLFIADTVPGHELAWIDHWMTVATEPGQEEHQERSLVGRLPVHTFGKLYIYSFSLKPLCNRYTTTECKHLSFHTSSCR